MTAIHAQSVGTVAAPVAQPAGTGAGPKAAAVEPATVAGPRSAFGKTLAQARGADDPRKRSGRGPAGAGSPLDGDDSTASTATSLIGAHLAHVGERHGSASGAPSGAGRAALDVTPSRRALFGVGSGAGTAQIRLGAGEDGGGASLRLVATGALVEAQLLTPHEAARQTLLAAMELARQRLRARGLELRWTGASKDGDARAVSSIERRRAGARAIPRPGRDGR